MPPATCRLRLPNHTWNFLGVLLVLPFTVSLPGCTVLGAVPACRYLPAVLPGAGGAVWVPACLFVTSAGFTCLNSFLLPQTTTHLCCHLQWRCLPFCCVPAWNSWVCGWVLPACLGLTCRFYRSCYRSASCLRSRMGLIPRHLPGTCLLLGLDGSGTLAPPAWRCRRRLLLPAACRLFPACLPALYLPFTSATLGYLPPCHLFCRFAACRSAVFWSAMVI